MREIIVVFREGLHLDSAIAGIYNILVNVSLHEYAGLQECYIAYKTLSCVHWTGRCIYACLKLCREDYK